MVLGGSVFRDPDCFASLKSLLKHTAIWEVVMERAWAQMSLLSFETLLWVKARSEYPEKS